MMILYHLSAVEKVYLRQSTRELIYPQEKIPVIEVQNVVELGKLTVLRFLEWVIAHPEGVIALPTGKSPEYFIKYLHHYKAHWNDQGVQLDLKSNGIDNLHFPDTTRLKFIQIDEFYPIDPCQHNSFNYYVRNYYLPLLGITQVNALLIDSSKIGLLSKTNYHRIFPKGNVDLLLREREPRNKLEILQKQAILEADNYCLDYEKKIRSWGGIGFFLGGIGPDGHIAFNIKGSDYSSRTRLLALNYESAAAAAADLGGIETARNKAVITIGLGTIIENKDITAIIIASGEAKSVMVASAVQNRQHPDYPAAILQDRTNARFYLTKGAASRLQAREIEDLKVIPTGTANQHLIDDILITVSLNCGKKLDDLKIEDLRSHLQGKALLEKLEPANIDHLLQGTKAAIIRKIQRGLHLPQGKTILHTSPHHDDIMLSYLPAMNYLAHTNTNFSAYLTSGFNALSNHFVEDLLIKVDRVYTNDELDLLFNHHERVILEQFTSAYKSNDYEKMHAVEELLFVKTIIRCFTITDIDHVHVKIRELRTYFHNAYPGQKDPHDIQIFKGAIRETESDRKWNIIGVPNYNIHHMRLHFYTGDLFTPAPTIDEDALPVYELMESINPDFVTVAFDPEGSGPDTHYKVLQIIAQAIRMAPDKKPLFWGYRNIWYRFTPAEATTFIPVQNADLLEMQKMFLSCFSSQKNASFPSYEYDGPFSGLAVKIQAEQKNIITQLLGDDYYKNEAFTDVQSNILKTTRGFVFLKEMDVDQFLHSARELQKSTELLDETLT
ncbi:MAG: hypothetical protein A2X43_03115 [Candidatus Margulisbacteria bacterium GWD2_39_127]|nr:MAG: hypothetical protein A2X43_03115 [Candidatus Margulisbacteria bacterium GWD2_39_127]